MKRLFLALPLSEEASLKLWTVWEPLRFSSRQIRWIGLEQFHITLVFLGDCKESLIPSLVDIMEETGENYSPIPVCTGGPGQFPLGGHPRVLFESLREGQNKTIKLNKHLRRHLSTMVDLEKRKFIPHITTARVKAKALDLPPSFVLPDWSGISDVLENFVLFESRLTPSGAVYTPLHITSLRGRR